MIHYILAIQPEGARVRAKAIPRNVTEPEATGAGRILRAGRLSLDLTSHRARLDGEDIRLLRLGTFLRGFRP